MLLPRCRVRNNTLYEEHQQTQNWQLLNVFSKCVRGLHPAGVHVRSLLQPDH